MSPVGRSRKGPVGRSRKGPVGRLRRTVVRSELQLDEEAFVERLADPGEKPANYETIIEINRGVRKLAPEERIEMELGPNNCAA